MNYLYRIKKSFFEERNPFYRIIDNDFYGISKRIKQIDPHLFIVYNALQGQYEVHDVSNRHSTFVLSAKTIDKEILNLINKIKGRDTIEITRLEKAKQKKYSNEKKKQYKEDALAFSMKQEYNTIVK